MTTSVKFTKWQIASLLFSRDAYIVLDVCQGILMCVTRESGSGRDFLLSILQTNGQVATVYIKTVD